MKMGITDTTLVAEKVAIWEGISGDKEKGDSIGVSILFLIPHDRCGVFANRKPN